MADQYGASTDQPDPTVQQDPLALATYWLNQLQYCERKYKRFWTRGEQIIKRYKNKRSYMSQSIPLTQKRMNVLWANVQTQMPVLFSQVPKANVQRRNKDRNPVGRMAAMVLERCLTNSMDMQPFDYTIEQNVQDLLLPGHSVSMTEYVAQVEQEQVGQQEARTRYVHWKDWVTNIARNWEEVWFWAYKSYLTRAEVKALLVRTGSKQERVDAVGRDIVLDHREDKSDDDSNAKATVWCIWDKNSKQVLHVATGYPREPLAVMPPPVSFADFFPIPRPLQATTASDSTMPVPDYDQYQDQADNIDLLVQRINRLIKSLRMRGAYAADMDSLKQLAENSSDQDMVPIDNWQLLMDKGGLEKALVWWPLEKIAQTLVWCYETLEKEIQIMYQVTGMSDIMRGATDPNETATAQQIKGQYAAVRTRDRQRDVQRYIRDIIRLQAEIISEHFTLQSLQAMSSLQLLTNQQKATIQKYQAYMQQYQQQAQQMAAQGMQPPPPPNIPAPTPDMMKALQEPTWEDIMALLRNEKLRGFVIDVETDSTVEADQMLEQQKAEQFITAVTQFMTAALPIIQAAPQTADMLGEMLQYGARQFRAGDALETTIEETVEKIKQFAEQPKPPPPDQMKAEAQVKTAQIGQQTAQVKANAEQQKANIDLVSTVVEHHQGMAERAMDAQLANQQHEQAMQQSQQPPAQPA